MHIILDNIRSGQNVGSLFRSADTFAAESIHLCGITPIPPHRDILKTALGATESVSWRHWPAIEACLQELKNAGCTLIAVEQTPDAKFLHHFDWPQNCAIILGNELEGVSAHALALCDMAVQIPQSGIKHSLNVAVAGGITMWSAWVASFK